MAMTTLSKRYWDLDWSRMTPWTSESGVICETTTFDEVLPFVREHYATIFEGTAERFHPDPLTEAKIRFMRETDVFALKEDGEVIGLMLSHPTDWATYYLRTAAILPDKQNRGAGMEWAARVAGVLKEAGVARFETETAPGNHRVTHALNRLGFVVTATYPTDRWGIMVRFTKFLDEKAGRSFADRYAMGSGIMKPATPRNERR